MWFSGAGAERQCANVSGPGTLEKSHGFQQQTVPVLFPSHLLFSLLHLEDYSLSVSEAVSYSLGQLGIISIYQHVYQFLCSLCVSFIVVKYK